MYFEGAMMGGCECGVKVHIKSGCSQIYEDRIG